MEIINKTYIQHIYHLWHELAAKGKIEDLIKLYDEEATLGSPLVPLLLKQGSNILKGYTEIYNFLVRGIQHRPYDLARREHTGYSLIKNNLLIWEYSRRITDNKQIIILETMQVRATKIFQHRVYWC